MTGAALPLGATAVLRVAGCPLAWWLAAGDPDLAVLAGELDALDDACATRGRALADELTRALVPLPGLDRGERSAVLAVRRLLHAGRTPRPRDVEVAAAAAGRLVGPSLAEALRTATAAAAERDARAAALTARVEAEDDRTARQALALVAAHPALRVLLDERNADAAATLARAHDARGKALRRAAAYVWPVLDRAAARTTPRDWHGHAALLPLGGAAARVRLTPRVAQAWRENLHVARRALTAARLAGAGDDVRLALAPIHFARGDRLHVWVVDHERDDAPLVELEMRRTAELDALCGALAGPARTLADLERALAPADADERALLHGFAAYLVGRGVIEVSSTPREEVRPWRDLAEVAAAPAGPAAAAPPGRHRKLDGFLDVYREVETALPRATAERIQDGLIQGLRVLAAMRADRSGGTGTGRDAPDSEAHPLLALVAQRVEARAAETAAPDAHADVDAGTDADATAPASPGPRTRDGEWPAPATPGSAYARLLAHLDGHAGDATLELDRAALDALGTPTTPIDWPLDAVVRVGASGVAVLDEVFPAGSLDARFIAALGRLQGAPHADAYRHFLARLEALTGVLFVELLMPPLAPAAANAVCRPAYTTAWTGDADVASYVRGAVPERHIPLAAIAIRRRRGRLRAEVDGRPIVPMYHATRVPLPPWDHVADLLIGTAPLPLRWTPRKLHRALDAFPHRGALPRLVAGGVVLAGRQWRPGALPWDRGADDTTKLRALARLRAQHAWPRCVYVSAGPGRKPAPCDLDSVRAPAILERAAALPGGDPLVIEMVPAHDDLLVEAADGAALASSIMLRLPVTETADALAARLAPALADWAA